MNRTTRNAIAMAIRPHTGHGKTRNDYFSIIEHIKPFGYMIGGKVADNYSEDMSRKHNAYQILNTATGEEIDSLLIIDEYFGDYRTDEKYEINAYVS